MSYAFSLIFSNCINFFSNQRFFWLAISRFFQIKFHDFFNGFLNRYQRNKLGISDSKLIKRG
jgi:hypothetical protein